MKTILLEFLRRLEEVVPPPENCHHAITFARYGSDKAGWQEKLALQVNKGGVYHCFFLDDGDFSIDTIRTIEAELAKATPPNAQLGVAIGQYLPVAKSLLCALFILLSLATSHAQTLGTVSSVTPASCIGASYVSKACFHAVVSCPGTKDLGLTFAYTNPQPQKASVLFFNGSGGTQPNGSNFQSTFTPAGIQIIQTAWDTLWEDTGLTVKNVRVAACRGATIGKYLHDNVHKTGKFGVQGSSAGSGLLAYWLAWYGGASLIDNAQFLSGPVFANIDQGCKVPKAVNISIAPTSGKAWSDMPWYGGPAFSVGQFTGHKCQPSNQTSAADSAAWLAQSVVHTGAVLSYSTPVAQWLCTPGPQQNNSAAQGFLFSSVVTSAKVVTGVNNCGGNEGVGTGTTQAGVRGSVDISNDMVKKLTQ